MILCHQQHVTKYMSSGYPVELLMDGQILFASLKYIIDQSSMSLLQQPASPTPPSEQSHQDARLSSESLHSCKPSQPSPSRGLQPPERR